MTKRWIIQQPAIADVTRLRKALGLPPLVAALLVNRQITDPEEARYFLSADLADLHDPFLLKHMDIAVARIKTACQRKEKVMVFGDYDVDGVTSSFLLTTTLRRMGLEVINHIPHRMRDGYGLNAGIGRLARDKGVTLLVTTDCGITAREEVRAINACGLEVIIIDHHEPEKGPLPEALAIINPKQPDCSYPFKHLAAVGLVTKFAHALEGRLHPEAVDFAAIGTVADVVPLKGENRILVKTGLGRLHQTRNKGLCALLSTSKLSGKKLRPYHIGFVIGPRINAAGRMDSARVSLDLFLCQDYSEAEALARTLEAHNIERQKMQRAIVQEAFDMIQKEAALADQRVIVVGKDGWHKGIVGIVASRLKDKYERPAVVIALKDGVGTASARSVKGFPLHEVLARCADMLEEFGGHAGAAGLTIKQENIHGFRERINRLADEILADEALRPELVIDREVAFEEIDLDGIERIQAMEPFGEGNPEPVFCSYRVRINSVPQVLGRNTLKFWAAQNGVTFSVVGFGFGEWRGRVHKGVLVDIAYTMGIDDWNKPPTPQLFLKDLRICPG